MQRGELFILSAPSGTGKTTLIRAAMERGLAAFGGVAFSISHTTRRPRPGEVDGVDYHFVSHDVFRRMIKDDRFLEHAEVHKVKDNFYGTSRDAVFPLLERGIDVVLDIDVQGAEQVMERCPEAHSIFILPPSFADLAGRLRGRNSEGAEQISVRLGVSLWEISRYERYRYVIINDDVERASNVLAAIILDKRHQIERQRDRIQRVLQDFAASADEARSPTSRRLKDPEETKHVGEDPGQD